MATHRPHAPTRSARATTAQALRTHWLTASVLVALCHLVSPVQGAPIHVTGQPVLRSLSVLPAGSDSMQVRGLVLDDADTPLSNAQVSIEDLPHQSCNPGSARTGADGAFCLMVEGSRGHQTRLKVGATADHLPYSTEITLSPRRSRVKLQLQVDSERLDLAQQVQRIGALLSSPPGAEEQYAIRLSIERSYAGQGTPRELWASTSVISTKRPAVFTPRSDQLGGPGPLTLVAEARIGEESLGRTELEVTATGLVQLNGPRQLDLSASGDGQLEVRATSHGQDVSSGSVIATATGLAPVQSIVSDGRAVLSLTLKPRMQSRVHTLRIEYQAAEPQFRPGPHLDVEIGSVPSSWWHRAPWMMLAGLAAFWVLRSWWRPALKRSPPKHKLTVSPERNLPNRTPVDAPPSGSRWGVVLDGHTGRTIAGACLVIRRPQLVDHSADDSESKSDSAGRFVFPPMQEPPEGSLLLVSSAGYSKLQVAAPPTGATTIAMTSIRRRLLERLVRWALGMGAPWARPERPPTPAEVAAQARAQGRPEIADWASAIQSAAYAPAPPGPDVEAALLSSTPPLDRPPGDKR